jgi:hypothetical protein
LFHSCRAVYQSVISADNDFWYTKRVRNGSALLSMVILLPYQSRKPHSAADFVIDLSYRNSSGM